MHAEWPPVATCQRRFDWCGNGLTDFCKISDLLVGECNGAMLKMIKRRSLPILYEINRRCDLSRKSLTGHVILRSGIQFIFGQSAHCCFVFANFMEGQNFFFDTLIVPSRKWGNKFCD